jgi:hypothetical protein
VVVSGEDRLVTEGESRGRSGVGPAAAGAD